MSLMQGQGNFGKMGYSDCQTPNSLIMINIWYKDGHQGQGVFKVKVIVSSRSFLSQTVSVWTSIMKRAVGLRLKG